VAAALTQAPFNALCIFAALGVGISAAVRAVVICAVDAPRAAQTRCLDGHAEAGVCIPVYATAACCCGWSRRKHRRSAWRGTRRKHSRRAGGVVLSEIPLRRRRRQGDVIATAVISLLLAIILRCVLRCRRGRSRETAQARRVDEWQPYRRRGRGAECVRPAVAGEFYGELVPDLSRQRAQCICRPPCKNISRQESHPDERRLTNRDPAITKAWPLSAAPALPLYLVYNSKPGSTEPLVLPQLLTAGAIQSAFADAPGK